MTPRPVTVTLELDTAVPLRDLRSARWWAIALADDDTGTAVVQAQANVIRPRKRKRQ